jgi:flagellar protein FliS
MTAAKAKKYIETQVTTATSEQLLLMLFDGGMRFARLGKECMRTNHWSEAFDYLKRSQRIAMELLCALDKNIGAELYGNLASLYKFIYFRLVEATLRKDEKLVDEALEIFSHLRETWALAVDKRRKDNPRESEESRANTARHAISVQG